MSNTQLWDSVYKTDPAHTKHFTKGGGFSGTAIKPFYLMHKATEVFGVCGIGWGWSELEHTVVVGVWCSKVELWFIYNNQRGTIQQWGQTVMQGKNKHGDFVDEEAPKKAVTDAVTKCLSYLGFAGDVHMGKFDDSKYVDEREKEEKKAATAKSVYGTATAMKKKYAEIVDAIEGALTHEQLKQVWIDNQAHIKAMQSFEFGEEYHAQLVSLKDERKAKITDEEVNNAAYKGNL